MRDFSLELAARVNEGMFFPRKTCRHLWTSLCLAGSLFQIILLAIQYFSYEISTTVSFIHENLTHFPSITICNRMLDTINWDDERTRKNCHKFLTPGDNCEKMNKSELIKAAHDLMVERRIEMTFAFMELFTVKQIITELTLNMEQLLRGHTRYNMGTGLTEPIYDFNETFEMSEFLSGVLRCSTLTWKKGHDVGEYLRLKRNYQLPGMFLLLVTNEEAAERLSLSFLDYAGNGQPFRNGYQNFILMQVSEGISSSSYDLFKSQLLKAPFATDCYDYSKIGFQNRGHCYETCLEKVTAAKFRLQPLGTRLDVQVDAMKAMSDSFLKANLAQMRALEEGCIKNCSRQDCYQEMYAARIKSSSQKVKAKQMAGHISYVPSSPITITDCSAKMTFTVFITDVGSVLGFWLGFSILQLTGWMRKRVKQVWRRIVTGYKGRSQVSANTGWHIVKTSKP